MATSEAKWEPWSTRPKGGVVLAWFDPEYVESVRILYGGGWEFAYDGDNLMRDPTHWMPLPNPPEADHDQA